MNSSPYDNGSGTQVISRAYLATTAAQLSVIDAITQNRAGGYTLAAPGALFAGYETGGVEGGSLYADPTIGRFGWNRADSATQYMEFSSGNTKHVGKWNNYITAGSKDGIFTGSVGWNFGTGGTTAIVLSYGPTMDSTMIPICQFRYPNTAMRQGQVTASTTTSFTYELASAGPSATNNGSVGFWCYRV
jgi:hypothetical protein